MKKLCCWLCMLLCLLPTVPACAHGLVLDGLELLDCITDDAGRIYLTGRPWGPGLHGGRIICLSPEGELLWQTAPEGILYSLAPMADGLLAGLRRTEDGPELWLLREGQVVSTQPIDRQCLRLHPVAGGILAECGGDTTRLLMLNDAGQQLWQLPLEASAVLTGAVSLPDGLYCTGYLYRDENVCAEAVLWRIAPGGQRCETVDRITNARFTALAQSDKGLAAAMDTEPDTGFAASELLLYGPAGRVGRARLNYGDRREGSLYALLATPDGWLAAAVRRKEHGQLLLLSFAADGTLLGELPLPMEALGTITGCRLVYTESGVLAVVCGRDPSEITLHHTVVVRVSGSDGITAQ